MTRKAIAFILFCPLFMYCGYYTKYEYYTKLIQSNPCDTHPGITFEAHGRLGNWMSSYANFIILSQEFGYQLYLPARFKQNLGGTFKNVTFPQIGRVHKS